VRCLKEGLRIVGGKDEDEDEDVDGYMEWADMCVVWFSLRRVEHGGHNATTESSCNRSKAHDTSKVR
jgi:hypothetical protein